jgi:aryl-alcohol dehydrogenase-like predicted oxidoreductase
MHYRPLGQSGLTVSEIGFGCNRLGEANMPDSHWIDLVRQAVELGVNVFDTSESYSWGRSETILGQAIGPRDDVLIASKVSRVQATNQKDFSAGRVIEQLEGSLRRLQRDYVDIYQLHSPSLAELQQFDWPEAMQTLKAQGKIRLTSVAINDAASGQWLLDQELVEVLQAPYNLLATDIAQLFDQAQAKGVAILTRVPMAQGILTGKFRPDQPVGAEHRATRAGARLEKYVKQTEHFRDWAAGHDLSLGQLALQYAISHPVISATIPGARTVEQLKQNVAASNGVGLSPANLAAVANIQQGLPAE